MAPPDGFQKIDGAPYVHFIVPPWFEQASGNGYLSGEMENLFRIRDGSAKPRGIANVGFHKFHPLPVLRTQPVDVPVNSATRKVVIKSDALSFRETASGQIRSDEAGAPSDKDSFVVL